MNSEEEYEVEERCVKPISVKGEEDAAQSEVKLLKEDINTTNHRAQPTPELLKGKYTVPVLLQTTPSPLKTGSKYQYKRGRQNNASPTSPNIFKATIQDQESRISQLMLENAEMQRQLECERMEKQKLMFEVNKNILAARTDKGDRSVNGNE